MRQEARRALIALALAVVPAGAAACETPRAPATPAPATPAKPAEPPPEPPPGPAPDPAMAEILVELRAERARMCACTDARCAEQAEVAQYEWSFAHRELLDRAKGTPAQEAEADTLIHDTEECAERFPH